MDIARDMKELHGKSMARLDELAAKHQDLDFEALMAKVFEDRDLAAQRDRFAGAMFGLDLFDVGKNTVLPKAMLDALSYSPGEDTEFFAPGEFAGWPLRIWPIMRRPFIRLNDLRIASTSSACSTTYTAYYGASLSILNPPTRNCGTTAKGGL